MTPAGQVPSPSATGGLATLSARAGLAWRVALILLGLACLGFGVAQLLSGGRSTDPGSVIPWLLGVLVVHDAVFAPLLFGVGLVLVRGMRLRRSLVRVIGTGLAVALCLVLVAIPALLTPGVPGNPTATPRDYRVGLLLLLAADLVGTGLLVGFRALPAARRRLRRQSAA